MFVERPDCLPNIEIIKGFEGIVEKPGSRQAGKGGRGKGRDRNSRQGKGKGGKGRRDRSRDPGPIFSGPVKPLEVSKNRWQKKDGLDEMAKLSSETLAILNKITPEKFTVLFAQLLDLDLSTPDRLVTVIDCIFDKALGEPAFCPLYSTLCARLSKDLPEMPLEEGGQPLSFRRLLLNKCQKEFEKEQELAHVESEDERGKMKRRMLGNIKFIGELYLKKMLMDKIMFVCMHNLAMAADPDEEDIEALCNLLTTIGYILETQSPKAKQPLDTTFARLKALKEAKPPVVQSRIRFMLQDLFDLRACLWRARNVTDGPTTLAEMRSIKQENPHQTAARKAQGRPNPCVQTSHREPRSQLNNPRPSSEIDGWAVAGQSRSKGVRSPKQESAEWEVHGNRRGRQGVRQRAAKLGGKLARQDARSLQKPMPAESKLVSSNTFAAMEGSDDGDEEEEQTEVHPMTGPVTMDPAWFTKKLGAIVDEYLASSDMTEACECFKELEASDKLLNTVVTDAVLHVMEKKQKQRSKVDELMAHLCKNGVTGEEHMVAGLTSLMEQVPNLVMDVPMFGQHVAHTTATLLAREVMKPAAIKGLFDSICGTSQGAKVFVWMFDHVASLTNVDLTRIQYEQCGLTGPDVMHKENRKEEEYKIVLNRVKCRNKVEWLFGLDTRLDN
eukprot:TRINITY_DN2043_c0_g1_i7.p1 TRINITY_DN2043_c0_g1~~TRINITY_DN2043_c0_g1_i7.p1  ORF type:complete len:669 (-),score=129.73 TRINITY_DN2043_c0_g1_i7:286-2292(-)